ncbi:hypothetical protein CWC22_011070 [Pseudoalteromonas rubra]|uniref:S1 motif domain-containing protein n=1 Tax=Pseudoalteromonas rubra TaxID=43658 RepID=A0A5S3V3T2_9GAMM|nr:hypothetical protein [Pseudoalteromonas rubra]QPB83499.1 hypothetical protein CWC22_011070 [Pseudoalteromonas rubra]
MDWRGKLTSLFPDWLEESGIKRFNNSNHNLKVGDEVRGIVICRAQFGVWADIGVGYPALIHFADFIAPDVKLDGYVGFPEVGESVNTIVNAISPRAEIDLIKKYNFRSIKINKRMGFKI